MTTGILWDLDGTLLDTLEDLQAATNYALAQYGCPARSLEEVRQFVGNGAARLIRLALPGRDKDPAWQDVLAAFRVYYDAHCQIKTKPYPGVLQALTELRHAFPMAIVSNKPDSAVKSLCRAYFGDLFACGESPARPRKPVPDMLRYAMEQIGADRCIYVGDSEVDIATAANAGVPCLSVLWGFRDRDTLLRAGARHLCQSPGDLPTAISQLTEESFYGK